MPRTTQSGDRAGRSTRAAASRTRSSGSAPASGGRSRMFVRGDEGRRKVDEEIEAQKNRSTGKYTPYNMRFYLSVGESRTIAILDDKPEMFIYEHGLRNPKDGKWNLFVPCIKGWDNCPVCESVKESQYVMFLTVLDFTPYTNRHGDTVEWSRKLLVVKSGQQKKFIRRYEKEGTLRGAVFTMTRDAKMEASIGEDIEFEEFMDEEELSEYTREYTRDNKKEVEDCSVPFDYDSMVQEPTYEQLAKLAGDADKEPRGNAERDRRRLEEEEEEEEDGWEDEEGSNKPWAEEEEEEEEEKPAPAARSRRSPGRRTAAAAEPAAEEEKPAAARPRRARRSEPEREEEPPARSAESRTRASGRIRRRVA